MTDKAYSDYTSDDLKDPTISAETLRDLAVGRPELWPQILQHPNAYPGLVAYIQAQQGQMPVGGQSTAPQAMPQPPMSGQPVATQPMPQQPGPVPAGAYAGMGVPNAAGQVGKPPVGFFGALFDVSFNHMVTPTIAKVAYILAIISIVISYVLAIFTTAAFSAQMSYDPYGYGSGGDTGWLMAFTIIGGGLMAFVAIIFTRMVLEFMVAGVRTAQNTTDIAEHRQR